MTAKQMIELIQQHHPHIGETEALLLLNQSKDDFCQDTEMVKTQSTFTTTANTLLYGDAELGEDGDGTPSTILKVLDVWIGDSGNEIKASRLQGTLNIKDSV
tara:strand:- start:705 stop:1010 length:306 start_codon:yes stop_codon:yes gene_type:complete